MATTPANALKFSFSTAQLGEDTLEVVSFVGREAISQPFRFELELLSTDPSVPFSDLMDQPATLVLHGEDEPWPVHGVVAHFEQGGPVGSDYYRYRAVLVPRLWRLSLTHQSRIFQEQSVQEIIEAVLTDAGFAGGDFEFLLQASYPAREYCTQYQETDLAFVSRLCEHEGIQFFFRQEGSREVVVFTDDRSQNPPIEGEDTVTYQRMDGFAQPHTETVQQFLFREQIVTGKVILKDHNYRTPEEKLCVESQINRDQPGTYYEYGPHFQDADEGDRLARVRNEEIECQRRAGQGEGTCLRLRAGHTFTLDQHYRLDLNHAYLVTEITHYGSQRGAMTMQAGEDAAVPYRNEFRCIPADVAFRPPRLTPEPRLPGVMTAKVETAGGLYAHLDDQGRYHAKMDFDLGDAVDGTATLPIPMNQGYSGADYGIHFPNHAGTEMIWACLNGDIDRPFALGTVPNPSQASPSTVRNKHQNVIRTWGKNELTFDDKQGEENIYLHATRNHTVEVKNDETITIGHDQSEWVRHNQRLQVDNNRDKVVGADQTEMVGANKTITVGGNHSETIVGNMTQNVAGAKAENITAAKSLAIGAAYQVTVGAAMNETVGGAKMEEVGAFKGEAIGGNKSETIGGSKSVSVGKSFSINVGDGQSLSVVKDLDEKIGGNHHEQVTKEWAVNAKKIQLMAEDQIVLKTGKAEIIMKKSGDIIIKGKKIQVKGSGDVVIKGSKIKEN
ncbi:MAG: type VI secretion system tip protein TssI/VgrG [Bacteroidota bacterium]